MKRSKGLYFLFGLLDRAAVVELYRRVGVVDSGKDGVNLASKVFSNHATSPSVW